MDPVSSAGVSSVAQHGVRLLLLVAERQEWCFLVCSSGLPSHPVALEQLLVQRVLGRLSVMRLLEAFPLLRASSSHCSHLEIWTLPSCAATQTRGVLSPFLQDGEVCTVDASSCSLSQRGSHFETGHYLYEFSMVAVWGFSTHFASFYALLRLSRS